MLIDMSNQMKQPHNIELSYSLMWDPVEGFFLTDLTFPVCEMGVIAGPVQKANLSIEGPEERHWM